MKLGRLLAMTLATAVVSCSLPTALSYADGSATDPGTDHPTSPYPEVFDDSGVGTRIEAKNMPTEHSGALNVDEQVRAMGSKFPAPVVKIQETGPTNQRFNMVFLGDGYTKGEQDKFVQRVKEKWEWFAKYEPFKSYKQWFNVYAVKVVSRESGADESPQGTKRNTAIGATFYCGGTARLLCVDTNRARELAKNAPKVDQINVLVNTSTYGGAGYPTEGIATAAADNPSSADIMVHEVGHSMGGLMDEYDYGGQTYSGPEPSAPNVSIYNSQQMKAKGTKWAKYLGRATPDGGTIGTYLGGFERYSNGIYRPSQDSMMRNLGKPFNIVSQVAIIAGIRSKAPGAKPGSPPGGGTQPTQPSQPTTAPTTKPTTRPTSNPTSAPDKPSPTQGPKPTVKPTVAPTTSPTKLPYDPNDPGQVDDWNLFKNMWEWLRRLFGGQKP